MMVNIFFLQNYVNKKLFVHQSIKDALYSVGQGKGKY